MKTLIQTLFFFILTTQICFGQDFNSNNQQDYKSRKFMMKSHNPNLKSFPEKSFYKQKEDWQYIIDTTWGPGLPLAQKQQIFNMFANSLHNSFDGFNSLGMTIEDWDTLRNYYYSKINSTTSRGRFSAIMNYLCSKLRDGHTYCDDIGVYSTPLNPGVPFFMFSGNIRNVEHFGAVTTILPDSNVMILRVVNNHPLNLVPGDIILGYEGVPWKDLIVELMNAELPNYDWWGAYEGTYTDHLFIGAGMNWHLFDTIDILKYSTGDTVHLSVAPLVNLNVPSMLNNEQIEIPNIPFPNYFNGQYVSYGILNNTNIGYIYVLSETGTGNSNFDQAVASLQNTDALIIDMRWNEGGTTSWSGAFNILANESFPTLEYAMRCSPSDFTLCPNGNVGTCFVNGSQTKYDRPIAVLLGPTCISTGDRNAYRLKYLYNVKTFGKPTWGTPGWDIDFSTSTWYMRHSTGDAFHTNNPGYYLQRREFPIDYPVWHNRDDVAVGKDAVVEKALWWINNLVYPHDNVTDKTYYSPSDDTIHFSTIIENPNSHQLSARAYLKTIEGVLIDSVNLEKQTLNSDSENWIARISKPSFEEIFKIALTVFDETASERFTVPNATRFATSGPVVLDSVTYTKNFGKYFCRPYITNKGDSSLHNISGKLISNDAWVTTINPSTWLIQNLPPDVSTPSVGALIVSVIDTLFPAYFNFEAHIGCDNWPFWEDSILVIVGVEDEISSPTEFLLLQNYPNPFNPSTIISYQLPVSSDVTLKVYDVLGNEIATLVDEYKPSSRYEVEFDAVSLPSGVYFYQLRAGDFIQTRKMILIK
ncbi:MAG: T9SS type A sorting domain-containing protein [bacterium]|nr:T9SS type A sorting domain-containing protein [bacterium]